MDLFWEYVAVFVLLAIIILQLEEVLITRSMVRLRRRIVNIQKLLNISDVIQEADFSSIETINERLNRLEEWAKEHDERKVQEEL